MNLNEKVASLYHKSAVLPSLPARVATAVLDQMPPNTLVIQDRQAFSERFLAASGRQKTDIVFISSIDEALYAISESKGVYGDQSPYIIVANQHFKPLNFEQIHAMCSTNAILTMSMVNDSHVGWRRDDRDQPIQSIGLHSTTGETNYRSIAERLSFLKRELLGQKVEYRSPEKEHQLRKNYIETRKKNSGDIHISTFALGENTLAHIEAAGEVRFRTAAEIDETLREAGRKVLKIYPVGVSAGKQEGFWSAFKVLIMRSKSQELFFTSVPQLWAHIIIDAMKRKDFQHNDLSTLPKGYSPEEYDAAVLNGEISSDRVLIVDVKEQSQVNIELP